MELIKNLPWKWIAGIIVLGVAFKIYASRNVQTEETNNSSQGSAATGITPMFGISAGGSSASAGMDVPVLGGDVWGSPAGDTGVSDAVLIQQSNERIALDQSTTQRYIADKSFQLLYEPTTNTNNTGNMGMEILPGGSYNGAPLIISPSLQANLNALSQDPQAQFQAGYTTPSQNINTGHVSTSDAIAFVGQAAAKGDYYSIYSQASSRGYTAAETATLFNASGAAGVGAISAADVNAWTREQGLAPLK